MENYGGFGNGAGCVVVLALVVVLVVVVGLPLLAGQVENAMAEREYAKAVRIDAETRQQHQQSVDFQHEFMLWSVAFKSSGLELVLVVLVVGALALAGGFALGSVR